ncbi:hypothetical protein [Ferrovibrio xuzhouensis]|uniref:Uncharacterized protein n=1 Tax=Ferrovibrio xuzhouensis TaxID=1576914 RepID=A0ABV7VKV3_9PROT
MSTEAPIASADDSTSAPGPAGPASRPYTKIDWKQAAALIAGGRTVEATAVALGLAPERIWRHLNRSLRFRFYLRQAIERQRLEAELHLAAAARDAVLARSRDPAGLDGADLRWLAGEGGLSGCAGRRAAEQGGAGEDLVMQLAATGNRPPSQALRRRLAARQAEMDRFMAEARDELAAAEAGWRAADAGAAPVTAPGAAGAEQAGTVTSGHERAETVTSGPERSAAGASGLQRSSAGTSGPERTATVTAGAEEDAAPDDRERDCRIPRPYLSGAVIDLPPSTDAAGNPLEPEAAADGTSRAGFRAGGRDG